MPGALDNRFDTVADLARGLRERLLEDRTISFTYGVAQTSDGEPSPSPNDYFGDGEYLVGPARTDSRHRNPLQSTRREIDLIAVGPKVFIRGTDDGTSRGPWRSQPPEQIVDQVLEVRNATWLTRLDSLYEAFAMRGVSESRRGDRAVVEYRLAADVQEALDLTALHLDLPPLPYRMTGEVEVLFNLALDADDRLVDARFVVLAGGSSHDTVYEFSRWGEPVADIVAPPADLVD
ncbi:hypothetical protein ACVGOW_21470 [Pseudonocardia saturnea]